MGLDLGGADLSHGDFSESMFIDAKLIGTRFVGADLYRSYALAADFSRADLTGSSLVRVELDDAVMREAVLDGADLAKASLCDVDAMGASCRGAQFMGSALLAVDFRSADLSGVALGSSSFRVTVDEATKVEALTGTVTGPVTLVDRAGRRQLAGTELEVWLRERGGDVPGRLRVPVFHTWDGGLPWINRVALPGGGVTLARVAEPGGPEAGFSVEAAEAPITGMPHVPVLHLPEVVRAFPVPTPLTDAVLPMGAVSGPERRARGALAAWERLCVRLQSGWPPRGWYSAALYAEDLAWRDTLAAALADLPDGLRREATGLLRELDGEYRASTLNDAGHALAAALRTEGFTAAPPPGRAWYWNRRPRYLPWAEPK
ncbi:pentapeptide repeat-containing protein [Streptomyces sp. NPDC059631]|uniref:pentapeptide repeat-containing protein n=1 Tax=unclassified Streptomyces TaxID=2593676 RepID=UPI0036BC6A9C